MVSTQDKDTKRGRVTSKTPFFETLRQSSKVRAKIISDVKRRRLFPL